MQAHKLTREGEMCQGVAIEIEESGIIHGYSARLGPLDHYVASSNEDLKTLIIGTSAIIGPGFFVLARKREIVMWLLEQGFII